MGCSSGSCGTGSGDGATTGGAFVPLGNLTKPVLATPPPISRPTPVKVPAGTQPGTAFRVKGKGVKNLQGYGQGDLHVRVQVEVPTHLNSAQKSKLTEFAAMCDGKEAPIAQGFFEKAKKFFK